MNRLFSDPLQWIRQPIIHDRHIVKQQFEVLKSEVAPNTYKCPDNLTIVTCRNEGSLSDRIIPHLAGYENVSILESNLKTFEDSFDDDEQEKYYKTVKKHTKLLDLNRGQHIKDHIPELEKFIYG